MIEQEETGEKESLEASPAPETQDNQSAPEAQPAPEAAGVPPTGEGVTPAGKVYTEAEVQNIVRERTKSFADVKRQYEAYRQLGSVDEIATRLKPAPQPAVEQPKLDEDDQKFVAYLKKVLPGLNKLEASGGLDPEQAQFLNQLRERDASVKMDYLNNAEADIYKHCDSIKVTGEDQRILVRDMVASIILNSPEISAKWAKNDPTAVSDAIKVMNSTLGVKSAEIAQQQTLAAAKNKATLVKAPLPPGGIGAPITKERKLTDEERLEAAWATIKNK